ncbi:hypothetical protein B0T19DRAFT_431205 [Cercophora scortea]|uniref:Uncharacterized protein n=1 Tax=Cercophora scortea TaxID=314031 RepID=A0AAE0I9F7_9PEZI|nr:hypothetical protein B0T19DRAFT_431205 [Cercophora scortea]
MIPRRERMHGMRAWNSCRWTDGCFSILIEPRARRYTPTFYFLVLGTTGGGFVRVGPWGVIIIITFVSLNTRHGHYTMMGSLHCLNSKEVSQGLSVGLDSGRCAIFVYSTTLSNIGCMYLHNLKR